MHLFFYFRLLALLLNVANKITDGNPLKAKLGIFVDEQEVTDHESLRTTGLVYKLN